MGPRPRFLVEIKTSRIHPLARRAKRVFCAAPRQNVAAPKRWSRLLEIFAVGLVAPYLLLGSVWAPVQHAAIFAAQNSAEDRTALERQLSQLEQQISQYESTVTSYKKQGKNLQAEIDRLNGQIQKSTLQIKAIELSLSKLDEEIGQNKKQVATAEENLNLNKSALTEALRNLYESDRVELIARLLGSRQLSDFTSDFNDLLTLQVSFQEVVRKVASLREDLLDAQQQLATKRTDASTLKKYQDATRQSLQDVKKEKNGLLATTKGQESKYQELLKQTKKSAAEIRSQIFEFLGGGELTFEEAYKFAKVAESATGVRAALVLAVLDRESALGQNVGRCNYKTAMHPRRDIPVFLTLVQALDINPDTVTVSCANADGVYGGAMGPAQFIPSTWDLYAVRVGEITGNNPPSPWRNGDAFVASALHLKDAGAVKGASISEERRAAARYYAGSRWQRFLWTYGERVIIKAKDFQDDIDVLEGKS